MRFFFLMFSAFTVLATVTFFVVGPGSGAGIFAVFCAALAIGVGAYNWVANGSPLAEGRAIPPAAPNAPK